jgi:hypothetical protein
VPVIRSSDATTALPVASWPVTIRRTAKVMFASLSY